MPTEGTLPRFNSSEIPDGAYSLTWNGNQRDSSPGRDARISRQSRPYWQCDLSDLLLNETQKNDLNAMTVRQKGQWSPVLMRVPEFCEIGQSTTADYLGNAIVTPEVLGTCTAPGQSFQIRKRYLLSGYEGEYYWYNVLKPEWDYPDLYQIGSTISGPIPWRPMKPVSVYADGVLLVPFVDFTVNREVGVVTSQVTGALTVSGGFYVQMLLPNRIPKTPENGLYRVSSGITMDEPAGL